MIIDLRTLSLVTGMIYTLMAIALILQYLLNRYYRGIGLWAAGLSVTAAGFIALNLRDITGIKTVSILTANTLLLSGMIVIYAGTVKFMLKKWNRGIIIPVFILFIISTFYVIYIKRNDNIRVVILYIALIAIISLIIHTLLVNEVQSIRIPAILTAAVFTIFGSFLLFRAVIIIISKLDVAVFTPVYLQTAAFIISLLSGILWTFGFVIMVNQRLNAELSEQKERFELIFNLSPEATAISRLKDRRIVYVNDSYTAITGFKRGEVLGKTSSELNLWTNPDDYARMVNMIKEKGSCINYETVINVKSGKLITCIFSAQIITLKGIPHFLTIARDITERILYENKIKSLLEEKELILKEVHHRIKNNMNNIKGLLFLQAETLSEPSAIAALNDAESRVGSMMTMYDRLYRTDVFAALPAREYITGLAEEIIAGFPNRDVVKVEKFIDDFTIDSEKLFELGIIINEIITNIMKYAFTGRTEGIITIVATSSENRTTLVIGDNGIGMPGDIDFENPAKFGLHLIITLAKQIGGSIRMEQGDGTRFILDF